MSAYVWYFSYAGIRLYDTQQWTMTDIEQDYESRTKISEYPHE